MAKNVPPVQQMQHVMEKLLNVQKISRWLAINVCVLTERFRAMVEGAHVLHVQNMPNVMQKGIGSV